MTRSAAACATLLSLSATAAIYESPITAEDEDDLRSAAERGDISDATAETLVELLQDGVDLNTANRDELYELPGLTYADVDAIIAFRKATPIEDPAALVAAGAITAEQLEEIAVFIVVSGGPTKIPFGGYYHLLGAYTVGDQIGPPAVLQARLRGPFALSAGVLTTVTRLHNGVPFYDPDRSNGVGSVGTLTTGPTDYRFEVPKFFLQWKGSKLKVIAGTFRIGFGQRLTLDNTTRTTPSGITADEVYFIYPNLVSNCRLSTGDPGAETCGDKRYQTPDFRWREGFRGVALAAEDLELGETARASLYAFGSYQSRSLYQYATFSHTGGCTDPRDDANPDCASPDTYLRVGDGTGPEPKVAYTTLPSLFDELAAGGHAQLSPLPNFSLGITGYFAMPFWRAPELELDFQEWSKYPFGGPWGALGIDSRLTLGNFNFYVELARTFDRETGGGGGWGAVQRTVWGRKQHEFEADARVYDIKFVNPYARPVSSPDVVDGQRARDEAGLLLKYTDRSLGDLRITSLLDFWVLPWAAKALDYGITGMVTGAKAGTWKTHALLRLDYEGWTFFEPSLWFDFRDQDITETNATPLDMGGTGQKCYSVANGLPTGSTVCTGERYRLGTRLNFRPFGRKLELMLTYLHDFYSTPKYTHLGQDLRFTAEIRSQPLDWLLIRLRTRYTNDDLFSSGAGETGGTCIDLSSGGDTAPCVQESLWTYAEVTWLGWKPMHISARYDVKVWLDHRTSTTTRIPNPEHRLRLELEGRF